MYNNYNSVTDTNQPINVGKGTGGLLLLLRTRAFQSNDTLQRTRTPKTLWAGLG